MNCNDITLINLNSTILVCWVCLHLVSSWNCDGCSEVPEEPLGIPNNEVLSLVWRALRFHHGSTAWYKRKIQRNSWFIRLWVQQHRERKVSHKKSNKNKTRANRKKQTQKTTKKKRRTKNQKLGGTQVLYFIIFWFVRVILPVSFFPECGFPFHSGGLGAECVFAWSCATVRSRSQPFAWGRYGLASGEFCKSGHFWRFQMSRSLVSRGRRGTLWHSNVFSYSVKNRFVWQGQYFCVVFQKMSCVSRGRRSTLVTSIFVLRGRRSASDVSCCVFCESHCQGCVKWWQGGIPTTCFIKCRKSVCVTGFASFSED